jgi:hypothetical protein
VGSSSSLIRSRREGEKGAVFHDVVHENKWILG